MNCKKYLLIFSLAIVTSTVSAAGADDSFVKPLEVKLNAMASELTEKLAFDRSNRHKIDVVKDCNADNKGKQTTTVELQKAIDIAAKKDNSIVYFPAGEYITGTLLLKSGVHIVLAKGAKIVASTPEVEANSTTKVTAGDVNKALIYGDKIENVSITGHGSIDCRGGDAAYISSGNNSPHRPLGIRIINGKNIYVSGIFMNNSAQWMQHYLDCDNVMIENIEVFNHANYNNDGIDIDGCRNVYIRNCKVDSDDDGICLKSRGLTGCENILIENCIVASHCNAIKLGTESVVGFKNVIARNCKVVQSATGSKNVNGVQTTRTAITLIVTDGGIMENIYFDNIDAEQCVTPIFITLGNRLRKYNDKAPATGEGAMSNIKLSNIKAISAGPISSMATGLSKKNMIRNLTLENIFIQLTNKGNEADKSVDMDAIMLKAKSGYPSPHMWKTNMPSSGLYFRYIDSLTLRNITIDNICADPREKIIIEDSVDAITSQK